MCVFMSPMAALPFERFRALLAFLAARSGVERAYSTSLGRSCVPRYAHHTSFGAATAEPFQGTGPCNP